MADEKRISGSSLVSFSDAARSAFGSVPGDPDREGLKTAEVSGMWMSGGGFVGVPQFNVELRVHSPRPYGDGGGQPQEPPWRCDEWHAYHDFMPGSPPTLHVGATCTAPTNGYRFALVRHEPQGINERDLLLRLLVAEADISNDVITSYEVHYSEDTDMRYDSVSILPDGPTGLEIQIVQ